MNWLVSMSRPTPRKSEKRFAVWLTSFGRWRTKLRIERVSDSPSRELGLVLQFTVLEALRSPQETPGPVPRSRSFGFPSSIHFFANVSPSRSPSREGRIPEEGHAGKLGNNL